MDRLLVPLDGSPLADAALPRAARLLDDGGEVVLLRVLPPGADAREREAAGAHLEAARRSLSGVRASPVVREGDPAAELLAEAARLSPSLVVMSSHGRGGVLRFVRGSVAERVLRASPAPLLVLTAEALRRPDAPLRRLLLPIDGGPPTPPVPALVERLALREGAEVVLVRVLTRRTLPSLFAVDPAAPLRPAIERLEALGVPVRAFGGWGDPAAEILETADHHGCDLIAITTRRRPGRALPPWDAVTEKVLRHARTPLLVLPSAE
ncbi:MAG: universal stress protein [Planctomycetes bacterium]|nr:universal stress protein [Planctomycetota bacterium]